VITGFQHRGLKRFFERGDARALHPDHVPKIRRLLARLNAATAIQDLAAPGHRLHPLKGPRQGVWAIDVSRTWRLTFRFDGNNCFDVDYEDYHGGDEP
jgi:proteic killer suppression protein